MINNSVVPQLPGHKFNDPYKQTYHKNQLFNYTNKTCLGNN